MATSLEKLAQLREDFLCSPPSPDAGGAELMLRTMLERAWPMLEQLIPADPAELDALLERGVTVLLELCSDDAGVIDGTVVADGYDAPALPAGDG